MTTIETADGLALEADWSLPRESPRGGIVFCHPHPQFGGTMSAPLMKMVASLLAHDGFAVLRFNFRGVGASEGSWGGGEAEIADVAAAVGFATAAHPDLPLGIAGWSFGAVTALGWQASVRSSLPYAGIAPAVHFEGRVRVPGPDALAAADRLFIIGDHDQYTSVEELQEYSDTIGSRLEVMAGSDHFFLFRHDRLARIVGDHFADASR